MPHWSTCSFCHLFCSQVHCQIGWFWRIWTKKVYIYISGVLTFGGLKSTCRPFLDIMHGSQPLLVGGQNFLTSALRKFRWSKLPAVRNADRRKVHSRGGFLQLQRNRESFPVGLEVGTPHHSLCFQTTHHIIVYISGNCNTSTNGHGCCLYQDI